MATHPERYEKKSGGGCLMLFGLPFLAVGLAVMVIGLTGWKDESGNSLPVFFTIPFGGIFALVGAGLMFGRSGIVFDKRTNQAVKWWGLLVPIKQTVVPLDSLEQVVITKEIRQSDKSTYTVYPVRVSHGVEQFKICEPRDYMTSRKEAEEVAKFLDLELRDASSGGEGVVRQASELDQSIREQAQTKGEVVEVPPAPAGSRVKHMLSGGKLTLEVPTPGSSTVMLVGMVVVCLVPVCFMAFFLKDFFKLDDAPPLFRYIFIGFALLFLAPAVLVPGRMMLVAMSRERIAVTPNNLEVSLVSPLMTKSKSIPAAEIEELELIPGFRLPDRGGDVDKVPEFVKGLAVIAGGGATIMARSDKQTLSFGRMLSREEAEWTHALIKRVLTS